jgi:hypothetical protein
MIEFNVSMAGGSGDDPDRLTYADQVGKKAGLGDVDLFERYYFSGVHQTLVDCVAPAHGLQVMVGSSRNPNLPLDESWGLTSMEPNFAAGLQESCQRPRGQVTLCSFKVVADERAKLFPPVT